MSVRLLSAIAILIVAAALVSQAVEQGTKEAYPTPKLLSDLAKIAAGGLFAGSGIALISTANSNAGKKNRRNKR